jgi:hypothetical protein
MTSYKEINECIEECEGAFTNLRNAANQMPDGTAKQALQSAARNLEACIMPQPLGHFYFP